MKFDMDGDATAPCADRRAGDATPGDKGEISRVSGQRSHRNHIVRSDASADAGPPIPTLRKVARQCQKFSPPTPPRPAIANDIANAFKELVAHSQAREKAIDQEQKRVTKARADFEHDFKHVMKEVIAPTLGEIGKLLQQSGWTCKTIPLPSDVSAGVSFEASRAGMKAVEGKGLPHITFSSVPEHLRLGITSLTRSSGSGRLEYSLKEVSNDFVAQQVLLFFHRLTNEWAGPDN